VRHTATGWWLEEAGAVEPTPPLAGETTADVVVVGGGFLGLWTASAPARCSSSGSASRPSRLATRAARSSAARSSEQTTSKTGDGVPIR
jgi:hypothetical protein